MINELPAIGYPSLEWVGGGGGGSGKHYKSLEGKYVDREKICIEVQENEFGERSMRFRRRFLSQMDLGNVDAWKMQVRHEW